MGFILKSENPLKYADTDTGQDLPVRYYTDAATGAVVAFVLHEKRAWIQQMRISPGKAGEPMPEKTALKQLVGANSLEEPSGELSAAQIQAVNSATSLTPKEVK